MRTPIVVCLLLSLAAGPVLAQDKAPAEAAKAEPAKPRDGEAEPKSAGTGCEPQTWIIQGRADQGSPDWIVPAKPERGSGDARR